MWKTEILTNAKMKRHKIEFKVLVGRSWVWQCNICNPSTGNLRKENQEFKASLHYISTLKPASALE
jgi:hypothetical protein